MNKNYPNYQKTLTTNFKISSKNMKEKLNKFNSNYKLKRGLIINLKISMNNLPVHLQC